MGPVDRISALAGGFLGYTSLKDGKTCGLVLPLYGSMMTGILQGPFYVQDTEEFEAILVPSFVKLLSRCPVLEFLTIEGITQCGDDQVNDIEVTGAQMKTLKIRTDGSVSFSFTGSVKSLVNVSIAFGEFEAEKPPIFCGLLDVVSSVKYLTLSASRFKDWHLPAFGNLNQLELVLWDCNYMELLALFLHSAPNLEDIILVCSTKFEVEDSVFQWNPPEEGPVCLSSHLKTISITGFKGRQAEIEMAKYLLKNGPFLKKMTISADLSYAEED
ncbi:hypothetical protein ACLB2K_052779 [Fragaria x ananassa]